MRFHGGGDDRQRQTTENAKFEASLNLRFAESGTKNRRNPNKPFFTFYSNDEVNEYLEANFAGKHGGDDSDAFNIFYKCLPGASGRTVKGEEKTLCTVYTLPAIKKQ